MDSSMMKGLVVGVVVATAGGAIASYTMLGDKQKGPEYAMVTNVAEIKETVKTPREVCEDIAVTRQAPVQDEQFRAQGQTRQGMPQVIAAARQLQIAAVLRPA